MVHLPGGGQIGQREECERTKCATICQLDQERDGITIIKIILLPMLASQSVSASRL